MSSVEGTRFLFSTGEMLRVSREIEQTCMVAPVDVLHVGVQLGEHLEAQADVYRMLTGAGVTVRAYGVDSGPAVLDVEWVRVPEDPHALESSWFLVREGETPHAVVGFELGDGRRGRRRWEGFESRDPLLVSGIVTHLDRVAARVGASHHRS